MSIHYIEFNSSKDYGLLRTLSFLLGAFLLALSASTDAAIIIDFDQLQSTAVHFKSIPTPYEEDGVALTTQAPATSIAMVGTLGTRRTGSPYLTAYDGGLNIALTALDPELGISLDSINIIEYLTAPATNITFHGTRFDDSVVSETISTDGVNDIVVDMGVPEFHAFSLLSGGPFKSISFAVGQEQFGFDNIALRLVSPTNTAVPEPTSGMLVLGAIGMTVVGLRARQQST